MVSGAGGAASGIGRTIVRNPKPSFYASVFIIAFSFVAANALWYQPQGGHLSPFLATRDPGDPNAIAGYRPFKPTDPADVTTFRIERAPVGGKGVQSQQAQSQPPPQAQPQLQQTQNQPYTGLPAAVPVNQSASTAAPTDDVRALIAGQSGAGQTGSGSAPAVDPMLVSSIQKALAGRGLYDGAADGLMGPRTQAAILFFEEASGLPQDGSPTPAVLAALQSQQNQAQPGQPQSNQVQTANLQSYPQAPTPIPRQAPRPVAVASRPQAMQPVSQPMGQSSGQHAAQPVKVAARGMDPITAAIRSAEHQPMLPPASIPGSGGAAIVPVAKRSDTPLPSNMVLQIQKGLSNIAYTDVELDGVAGTQTKAAIRRFQKHYRLPETGEPDQMVLNKLKAIGAL